MNKEDIVDTNRTIYKIVTDGYNKEALESYNKINNKVTKPIKISMEFSTPEDLYEFMKKNTGYYFKTE